MQGRRKKNVKMEEGEVARKEKKTLRARREKKMTARRENIFLTFI